MTPGPPRPGTPPTGSLPAGRAARALLPRRRLTATVLGIGLLAPAACSPGAQPVATDPELARDPLATVDQSAWDAREAGALTGLPIEGDLADFASWEEAGLDDSSVASTRQQLVDFLGAVYLSPSSFAGLSDAETRSRVDEVTPDFWKDDLAEAWDDGNRHFYAFALADPFAPVGAPRIAANWYRAEEGSVPQLMITGTFAHTVIDTSSREVGVVAQRFAMRVDLGAQGEAVRGTHQVTLHGLDLCATGEAGGRHVPAISTARAHQAVQSATMDQVIASPRVPRTALDSGSEDARQGDRETVLFCD